jgi:hypothetical protein
MKHKAYQTFRQRRLSHHLSFKSSLLLAAFFFLAQSPLLMAQTDESQAVEYSHENPLVDLGKQEEALSLFVDNEDRSLPVVPEPVPTPAPKPVAPVPTPAPKPVAPVVTPAPKPVAPVATPTPKPVAPVPTPAPKPVAPVPTPTPKPVAPVATPAPKPVAPVATPAPEKPAPQPENISPDRVITGAINELVVLAIDGEGWMMNNPGSDVTLLRKEYSATGQTRFTLRGSVAGDYTLRFNRNTAGGMVTYIVSFKVNAKVLPNQSAPVATNPPAPVATPPVQPKIPEQLAPVASLSEALQQAKAGNPAALLAQEANLSQDIANLSQADLLLAFRTYHKDGSNWPLIRKMGDHFAQKFAYHDDSAEVLYNLGQMYEKPGNQRDLRLARNYYQRAYKNYPLSRFSQMSAERIAYIDQYYLRMP